MKDSHISPGSSCLRRCPPRTQRPRIPHTATDLGGPEVEDTTSEPTTLNLIRVASGLQAKKAFHHRRTKKTKKKTGLIPKTKTNSIRLTRPQRLLVLQIGTGHALEPQLANRFVVTSSPQEHIPVFGTSRRTQSPVWLLKITTGRAPRAPRPSGLPVGDMAPAK